MSRKCGQVLLSTPPANLRRVSSRFREVSSSSPGSPRSTVRVAACGPSAYSSSALGRRCERLSEKPSEYSRAKVQTAPAENAVALGYVEGWRGEIFHWIRMGENGRLARCKVKDPSLQNWPALSEAILGNIIPDFPVINKSFNLSYCGNDL